MSGRNMSRWNFRVKGGQGFKKNNNGGRHNSATNKTMEGLNFTSVAQNKPAITKIQHYL